MALPKFNTSVANMQSLPDEPTTTADALKILMDKAPTDIQSYLNDTFIPALEAALELKQAIVDGVDNIKIAYLSNVASDIQAQLNAITEKTDEVTATELDRLAGVTGDVQAQLNSKQATILSGTAAPSSLASGAIYLRYPS
jgi:hypothetical protein